MGAACLCACRQVVQLHRRWMAQTKPSPNPPHPTPPPPPFLEIHRKKPGCCARAGLQIEADELIQNKTQHKSKQVSFTHL